MKFLLTLSAALLVTTSVFATEVKMCIITADVDPQVGNLYVEVVNGKADSMRVISTTDKKIVGDDSYPVESIMGKEGLVASQRSGHDIIIVRLENFSPSTGGTAVLDYLYNGITKKRRFLRLKLVSVDNTFVLQDQAGNKVNRLKLVGHKFLGQIIGFKAIETSFK